MSICYHVVNDPDGLHLVRLQVMFSAEADGCLKRICEKTGKTKREVVEMALIELARALCCNEKNLNLAEEG